MRTVGLGWVWLGVVGEAELAWVGMGCFGWLRQGWVGLGWVGLVGWPGRGRSQQSRTHTYRWVVPWGLV